LHFFQLLSLSLSLSFWPASDCSLLTPDYFSLSCGQKTTRKPNLHSLCSSFSLPAFSPRLARALKRAARDANANAKAKVDFSTQTLTQTLTQTSLLLPLKARLTSLTIELNSYFDARPNHCQLPTSSQTAGRPPNAPPFMALLPLLHRHFSSAGPIWSAPKLASGSPVVRLRTGGVAGCIRRGACGARATVPGRPQSELAGRGAACAHTQPAGLPTRPVCGGSLAAPKVGQKSANGWPKVGQNSSLGPINHLSAGPLELLAQTPTGQLLSLSH